AVVDVAEVILELAAAERLDRDDRAILLELESGCVDDLLLEPEAAVDLDGALVEHRRPRMDGRARVPLDPHGLDARLREPERRRQRDEAAACDQNRGLVHASSSRSLPRPPPGTPPRRPPPPESRRSAGARHSGTSAPPRPGSAPPMRPPDRLGGAGPPRPTRAMSGQRCGATTSAASGRTGSSTRRARRRSPPGIAQRGTRVAEAPTRHRTA